jgi:hypothetical protein
MANFVRGRFIFIRFPNNFDLFLQSFVHFIQYSVPFSH